jgi:hypothetical protein
MRKNLIIIFSLFISLNITSIAKAGTAEAVSYINTIHSIMLCGTGSTTTSCANPVILGSTVSGSSFDLSSISAGASAGSLGNLGKASPGQTFSFMQVILSKTFTIKGTGTNAASATCYTAANGSGGTATSGTTQAIGSASSGQYASQVVKVADNASLDSNMRGTNNLDGTTSGDAANGSAGTNTYMGFITQLTSPFTMKAGSIPQMKIAFDLSTAVNFPASNCTVSPSSPSVTVTFLN